MLPGIQIGIWRYLYICILVRLVVAVWLLDHLPVQHDFV